ncbi:MAG: efflux RND transporter periplasmic adaptor subunit, partial [Candidatus Omnitrophica bacterium]|nr:efflux RND transporter periplasmic adaptor subunit [Candidatus Omnitrophota bacterium]
MLAKRDYAGIATYEIAGQKYDRLILEDIINKQSQIAAAQLSVEQAKQNIELYKRTLDQAQMSIKVARKQLDNATMVAPIDGIVISLDVKEGDTVLSPTMSSRAIMYIIDPKSIEINAQIDEIDIASIKLGQRVVINMDSLPDSKFEGKVTAIDLVPVANPANSGVVVYEVKIGFAEIPAAVKVGMSATVDI